MQEKPKYYRMFFTWRLLCWVYDLWVAIAVLGQTKSLRTKIIEYIPRTATTIIDLATGTGETALEIRKAFPQAHIAASDLSEAMLQIAERKAQQQKADIAFSLQDAVRTNHQTGCADFVCMTFAIHDLPHTQRILVMKEALRLLKPGGRFAIYEYHDPKNLLLRIPLIIQFLVAENKDAWSILTENLQAELLEVGFAKSSKTLYYNGLAQIVVGEKR